MPEGHKTHFVAKEQTTLFAGKRLAVSSPQGRFADDAKQVDGKQLRAVEAAGKHLFYVFKNAPLVHVHLGRFGSYRIHSGSPEPKGLVRMRLSDGETTVDLNGPTQCRIITASRRIEIESKLGPDPLAGGRWQTAWSAVQKSKQPIGAILLDQTVIAGVGNIFRAELLFELRMNPTLAGQDLSEAQFRELWKSLTRMMKVGLKYGKIITVSATEAGKPIAKLETKERLRIYRKTDCPNCGGEISTLKVAARDLYVCRNCQMN